MSEDQPPPPASENALTADTGYQGLLGRISAVYTTGQLRAHQAVNAHLTQTYWQIGHDIVEFEQDGHTRAQYGKALLTTLSRDLSLRHGKGFSRSNVIYMRLLYLQYPKGQKPSDLLSWSHHVELLRIDDPLERSFYEKQPAHRHHPQPGKRRTARGIRHLQDGQPALRPEIPALSAQPGRTSP